jgi:hypothetical protein
MGLDLWFRDDVTRILAAAHETMQASTGAVAPLDVEAALAYRRGFVDALRAVGVAFGVATPTAGDQASRVETLAADRPWSAAYSLRPAGGNGAGRQGSGHG